MTQAVDFKRMYEPDESSRSPLCSPVSSPIPQETNYIRRRQAACLRAGLRAPPWGADGQTGAQGPMPRSGEAPVGRAGANW